MMWVNGRGMTALRSVSSGLAWCGLVRIVEEELIAVRVVDHQEPITPRTFLDCNAFGLKFGAQVIQCGGCGFVCGRFDVQGNEYQPFANLLRPLAGEDDRASLTFDLGDEDFAVLVVAPGVGEAELVQIKTERGHNVGHVEDGAREPLCHRRVSLNEEYLRWNSFRYVNASFSHEPTRKRQGRSVSPLLRSWPPFLQREC